MIFSLGPTFHLIRGGGLFTNGMVICPQHPPLLWAIIRVQCYHPTPPWTSLSKHLVEESSYDLYYLVYFSFWFIQLSCLLYNLLGSTTAHIAMPLRLSRPPSNGTGRIHHTCHPRPSDPRGVGVVRTRHICAIAYFTKGHFESLGAYESQANPMDTCLIQAP